MNEKILDSPFENEFHFKLKSDEEILWENEYFSGWSFSKLMRKNLSIIPIIIGCCIILTSILGLFFKRIDVNLLFGFIIITCIFLNYISQKRNPSIRYILTSQRLIFHTTKNKKEIVLNIPLPNIKTTDVNLTSFSNNKGNILIDAKHLSLEVNHEYFLEDIPNVENQFKRLVILNVNDTPGVLKLIRQAKLKALDL